MRRYDRHELLVFLRAVDSHLDESVQLLVIGGGAIALGYGVDVGTRDIDTYDSNVSVLRDALIEARRETGLDVPIDRAGVAELPYDFEDRTREILQDELSHLAVSVPDPVDLALSKLLRGDDHDLDQIAELHAVAPLDMETLVSRFEREMTHVIGNRRMQAYSVLDCVERLWGVLARKRVEPRLLGA